MSYGLVPKTFDGHDINDQVSYDAFFVEDSETLDNPSASAIEATRPGNTPVHAYMQPDGIRCVITIVILGELTNSKFETLRGWFDTVAGEEHTLVVTPEAGEGLDDRQITCVIEKLAVSGEGNNVFKVTLRAVQATWQAVDDSNNDFEVDTSGETFPIVNSGNTAAPVVFTLTANDAMNPASGPNKRRLVFVANRSEQALADYASEKYPIDINALGDLSSLGNQHRVFAYSQEIKRWIGASDQLWVNLGMRPGKFATLAVSMDADDTSLTCSDVEGFAGWPESGWVFVDSEPMLFLARTLFGLTNLYRPFPTTHTATAPLIFIEHVLQVVYGESSPSTPDAGLDEKPLIDLDASSNVLHVWPGPYFNDGDRRSRSWRRTLSDDGVSGHVRTYDGAAGDLLMEDEPPAIGKPAYAHAEMNFPVPLAGPLELDYDAGLSLLLQVRAVDEGGYESELLSVYNEAATAESLALDEDAVKLRVSGRIAAVAGEVDLTAGSSISMSPGSIGVNIDDPSSPGSDLLVYTPVHLAINFTLEEDTEIDKVGLKFANTTGVETVTFGIYELDKETRVFYGVFNANDADDMTFNDAVTRIGTLPAGSYKLILNPIAGSAITIAGTNRTKPLIYFSYEVLPSDLISTDPATVGGIGDNVLDSSGDHFLRAREVDFPVVDGQEFGTPVFAIFSKKADPQADAATETGNTISVDNISAPLDSDKAPKLYMGPEESCFLFQHVLENETTGHSVAITHPCKPGESLRIDCENAAVTDEETGLGANHAVEYSNPAKRLYLAASSNTYSLTGPGLSATETVTVAWETRDRFL